MSANIISVDEESLDALLDEVTSELVGAMHNERTMSDGFAETLAYVQRIRTLYPLDFHPFDATATSASMILRVSRDAVPVPPAKTPPRG